MKKSFVIRDPHGVLLDDGTGARKRFRGEIVEVDEQVNENIPVLLMQKRILRRETVTGHAKDSSVIVFEF